MASVSNAYDLTTSSKCLSYVLRHAALKEGLHIRDDGFVDVSEILSKRHLRSKLINEETIKRIVETDKKKRYQVIYEPDPASAHGTKMWIRASQGHSMETIDDSKLLRQITDPNEFPVVVHGTYLRNWPSIRKEGLKRMQRNHIHMAAGFPEENQILSGARMSCDLFIQIDLEKAMSVGGIVFHVSQNNVILTKGINGVLPPTYFKKVITKSGESLWV